MSRVDEGRAGVCRDEPGTSPREKRCGRCGGYCERVQTTPGVSVSCEPGLFVPCSVCDELTTVMWVTLRANGATSAVHSGCAR